jgi:predicted molibdopterin-dependent oxidoreductase YjgC
MQYETVLTTCAYCGTGCGLYLEVMDGELVGVIPCKSHPISRGSLCIKGWAVHEFVGSDRRLKTPMVRRDGKLEEAGWDEALDLVAERLGAIKSESGPDSIAILTSAKATNEENYLLQKLGRAVIGTNNIDHCARL